MALAATQKKQAKNKHYFNASSVGKDARFTISKAALGKVNKMATQNNYKKSVVVRSAIDMLFYKAETMEHKRFYKMVHLEYLRQSLRNANIAAGHKEKMLRSLDYIG